MQTEQSIFHNTVILGDCLEEMQKLPDKSVDMICTDPPYFLPIQSYVGSMEKGYEKRTLEDCSILKGYFKQIFREFIRVTKPSGVWYIFCNWESYPIFYELIFPICHSIRPLIWDKTASVYGYTWRHQYEMICFVTFSETERIPTGDGDVLKCRGVPQKGRNHPAEKPVELIKQLIMKHENLKFILDPYSGSGSTIIACLQTQRDYLGIELNENYVKRINERILEQTNGLNLWQTKVTSCQKESKDA